MSLAVISTITASAGKGIMSDFYCQEKGRLLVETKGGKRHVMRKSYAVKCTVLPTWTQDVKAHNFRMAAPHHTVQLGALTTAELFANKPQKRKFDGKIITTGKCFCSTQIHNHYPEFTQDHNYFSRDKAVNKTFDQADEWSHLGHIAFVLAHKWLCCCSALQEPPAWYVAAPHNRPAYSYCAQIRSAEPPRQNRQAKRHAAARQHAYSDTNQHACVLADK